MKASVRDSKTLRLISPQDLEVYLASRQWDYRPYGNLGAIYNRTKDGSEYELLVPLTREIGDFPQRISDILRTLEVVEERSQIEILSDLATTRADVVRFRRGEGADGTLPLDDGAVFVKSAYDMLLAAACTAVTPRLYYQGKRPGQATDYVQKARLGQSERGSYVMTVISPLPPQMDPQKGLFGPRDPFERKVTRLLSDGLEAAVEASEYALRSASTEHFRESAKDGVSANLLDAALGVMGADHRTVGVNFAWSPEIPIEAHSRIITIEADFAPVMEEASKFLKAQEPLPPIDLAGVVVGLRRTEGETHGRVTLLALVEARKSRHVSLELGQETYDIAIRAHRERRPVLCRGELQKVGKIMVLTNITRFEIAPEVDEDEGPAGPLFEDQ